MAGERPVWQRKDVEVWVNRNAGNTYDLTFTHVFPDGARVGNQVATALTTQEVHRMVTGILSALEHPSPPPAPPKEAEGAAQKCPECKRGLDQYGSICLVCGGTGRAGRGNAD